MKRGEDYTGISIVYFCHDGKGNYLFNKRGKNCRDENGRWDCGGGALEFNDKIEERLKKEIKEEYGTKVIKSQFLGYKDVHRKKGGKNTHWVALHFKVLVDPKTVKNGEPHKFDEVKWFNIKKLPKPLHSQLPFTLIKYKDVL